MNKKKCLSNNFNLLPKEIYIEIFSYCDDTSLLQIRLVNKELYSIFETSCYFLHFSTIFKLVREIGNNWKNCNFYNINLKLLKNVKRLQYNMSFQNWFDEKVTFFNLHICIDPELKSNKITDEIFEEIKKLKLSTRIIEKEHNPDRIFFRVKIILNDKILLIIYKASGEYNPKKIKISFWKQLTQNKKCRTINFDLNTKFNVFKSDSDIHKFEWEEYPNWNDIPKECVLKNNLLILRKELNILDILNDKMLLLYFFSLYEWVECFTP